MMASRLLPGGIAFPPVVLLDPGVQSIQTRLGSADINARDIEAWKKAASNVKIELK
jgi:hypothetical protein